MWLFPSIAAAVALAFAALLARDYVSRRRLSHALWTIALLLYAGAAIALAVGSAASAGWPPAAYRAYWLLGAVLNVPFLAAGEVCLLVRNRTARDVVVLVLVFGTAFALNRVRTAELVTAALGADLPRGSRVWAVDPFVLDLARLYSYGGYAVLLAGTAWSAWRMRAAPALRDRFLGTLAIAGGATIVAAGSAFAAAGNLAGFSTTITAGIAAMFWGFVRASRRSTRAPDPTARAPSAG
jgi:hypothetical protein